MQDFEEQERRLMAALGRLGAGFERLSEAPAAAMLEAAEPQDSAAEVEIARLSQLLEQARGEQIESEARAALARERQSVAQGALQEQLEAATAEGAAVTGQLDAVTGKLDAVMGQLEAQAADLQQQREVNAQLREALHALRGALAQGEVGAEGINMALAAEVAELRAARASEAREVAALLSGIDPLITTSAAPAQPAGGDVAAQQIDTEETDDARA